MRFVKASNSGQLVIDSDRDEIGRGGEGTVYAAGHLAAKIYHKPGPRREKIAAMLANPPEDSSTRGHQSIAWPVDALQDASGRFAGFLMPRVSGGGFRDVAHFVNRIKHRSHFTNYELHVVALNLASAFSALHKKNYLVGDVNDRNVLITDQGLVTVLDTDSFQVPKQSSGTVFRCTVKTPEFTPPELQRRNPGKLDRRVEHDLFGLAVLIFQLLMQGNHPFTGTDQHGWSIPTRIEKGNFPFGRSQQPIALTPQAPSLEVLAPELKTLFVRCFENGARDLTARPSAVEWRQALNTARQELMECSANPNHRYHRQSSQCPWCEIKGRVTVKGGGGLDYFPDSYVQIPLATPTQGKKLGKSKSRPSRPSPTPSQTFRPKPPPGMPKLPGHSSLSAASPPTPSAPAPQQPKTLGGWALKALGALATSYIENAVGQPANDFEAGTWEFRLTTPVPPMTPAPVLLGGRLVLAPNGTFTGAGQVQHLINQSRCQLTGQWQYDPNSKTLFASTMMNGMPVSQQEPLRIIGKSGNELQVLGGDGRQFLFRKVA